MGNPRRLEPNGPIHITTRFNSAHWSGVPSHVSGEGAVPYLRRRCCLFGHSSEEVASALLVGVQLLASGRTREEHEALVAAVSRLAAALMWSRGKAVESVMAAQDELGEHIPERIVEQTVHIAASSCEAGSSWPGDVDTTCADATAVAQSAGEARPTGISKHIASTASKLAASSSEAGSSRPGKTDTPVAAVTAVSTAKCRTTTAATAAARKR